MNRVEPLSCSMRGPGQVICMLRYTHAQPPYTHVCHEPSFALLRLGAGLAGSRVALDRRSRRADTPGHASRVVASRSASRRHVSNVAVFQSVFRLFLFIYSFCRVHAANIMRCPTIEFAENLLYTRACRVGFTALRVYRCTTHSPTTSFALSTTVR